MPCKPGLAALSLAARWTAVPQTVADGCGQRRGPCGVAPRLVRPGCWRRRLPGDKLTRGVAEPAGGGRYHGPAHRAPGTRAPWPRGRTPSKFDLRNYAYAMCSG